MILNAAPAQNSVFLKARPPAIPSSHRSNNLSPLCPCQIRTSAPLPLNQLLQFRAHQQAPRPPISRTRSLANPVILPCLITLPSPPTRRAPYCLVQAPCFSRPNLQLATSNLQL